MPLPNSGGLSWAQLAAEFEIPNPISTADMLRGGDYVPNTAANSSIPTSGNVVVPNHFWGADGTPILTLSDQLVSDRKNYSGASPSFAGYMVSANGKVYKDTSQTGTVFLENWHVPLARAPSNYQIKATASPSANVNGSPLGSWLALTTNRIWTLDTPTDGTLYNSNLTVQLRKGTGPVLLTATITLLASYADGGIRD